MRASDFDLLIVPRLGGADDDWSSRWRAKLTTARLIHPANRRELRREAWIGSIRDVVREAKRPILFVGHGLGAAAIAGAAHALAGADVHGAFLVVPPDDGALVRLASKDWTPTRGAGSRLGRGADRRRLRRLARRGERPRPVAG